MSLCSCVCVCVCVCVWERKVSRIISSVLQMCYEGRTEQRKWYVRGHFRNQTPSSSSPSPSSSSCCCFVCLVGWLRKKSSFVILKAKCCHNFRRSLSYTLSWRKQWEMWYIRKIMFSQYKKTWYISPDNLFFKWNLRLYCCISTTLKYLLCFDLGCDISALFSNSEEGIVLPIWLITLTTKSLDFCWLQDRKNEDQRIYNEW